MLDHDGAPIWRELVTAEPEARRRRCVVCHAEYPGTERFCPVDGGAVVADQPATDLDDPHLGKTIDGRYLVRRFIGQGGMGSVYEADHVGLDKRVAIKFLVDSAADRDTRARFHREARAASKVVHPHVVQIFDVGTDDGVAFIVMEYVEGRDLRQILEGGALDPVRAISIARQMLDGLGAIHSAGILHRDIKPGNVLLTTNGADRDVVKIMDFGISKELQGTPPTLTDTGKVVGTPQYMSPEQLSGATVDQRSDLYAVGLTLYEMLAGAPAFDGASSSVLAVMHLSQPPPSLDEVRPGLPATLVAAVARVLAKSPADRFADARAFADALGPDGGAATGSSNAVASRPSSRDAATVRESRPPVLAPAPPARDAPAPVSTGGRHSLRWAALALALAVAGGIALALVIRMRQPARSTTAPKDAIDAGAAPARLTAEQHLDFARAAENEGKLELAIAEYAAAQALQPGADPLFRIAGLYERLGARADAARYLRRYLDAAPTASDREVVTTRIAALEASVVDAGVDGPPTRPGSRPPTAKAPDTRRVRPAATCMCTPVNSIPDHASLCKALQPAMCRCRVGGDGVELCVLPFAKCPKSSTDWDCGAWGLPDYYKCPAPGYGKFEIRGTAGAPCAGYPSPSQTTPVDGKFDCSYCVDEDSHSFPGRPGDPCRGFHQRTGQPIAGVLDDCDQ